MTEDEKRDALLIALSEAYNRLGAQHTVLIGLVRALILERAAEDPEATQRLVDVVENAFQLDEAQRRFLADMTTVAPIEVTEEAQEMTVH